MAVLAGCRAFHFHGVACFAHPVGDILAEIRNMAGADLFPVAVLAIAFQVILVSPVGEGDAILEFENLCTVIGKSRT